MHSFSTRMNRRTDGRNMICYYGWHAAEEEEAATEAKTILENSKDEETGRKEFERAPPFARHIPEA